EDGYGSALVVGLDNGCETGVGGTIDLVGARTMSNVNFGVVVPTGDNGAETGEGLQAGGLSGDRRIHSCGDVGVTTGWHIGRQRAGVGDGSHPESVGDGRFQGVETDGVAVGPSGVLCLIDAGDLLGQLDLVGNSRAVNRGRP